MAFFNIYKKVTLNNKPKTGDKNNQSKLMQKLLKLIVNITNDFSVPQLLKQWEIWQILKLWSLRKHIDV